MWKKLLKQVLQEQQENRLFKDVELKRHVKTVPM